ncbi:putative membrane protein [Brevundimonas alba]|uniref:Putative membrane protein n=1 Tax=Brevundimonas alba TaxID=74314 RepID=A0A7X5YMP2_9CAUL|nr:heparan-alpha-glucosaminide N-acetyltransferase domain-containing protein [Brevundimonas alba]NJC41454.1 putative membrane protein [Brevundimonas alba]
MTAQPVEAAHDAPLASPAAAAANGVTRTGATRLDGIDALRGLVIVLMVLDHVRDFVHRTAFTADPLALGDAGDPALFMTRWITHLCAPTFVFLAGVSIWLQKANGKPRPELSRFLLTRGAWLIVLELTLVEWGFNFGGGLFLQVIWAIGASMLVIAALIWLPRFAILALGALVIVGHQAVGPVEPADFGPAGPVWQFAVEFGPAPFGGFIAYPVVQWLGIMMVGYGLGGLFTRPEPARTRAVLMLSGGLLVAFAVIRAVNGYGDPRPWAMQEDGLWTALSFINVAKYPPSLDYVLVTLGVSLALLPLLERLWRPARGVLLTFGRTPLFTYLLHVWLAHGLALAAGVAMGVPASAFFNMLADPSRLTAAGWGFGLPGLYAFWLLTVALLYPASRWFEGVKRRRRDWWLGYI